MQKSRKFTALTIALCIIANIAMPSGNVIAKEEKENSYIISTKTESAIKRFQKTYDGEQITDHQTIAEINLTKSEASKLQNDKNVLHIEKNVTLSGDSIKSKTINKTLIVPNDEVPNQWNRSAIGITNSTLANKKVKVELLDSGVSSNDDIEVSQNVNLVNPTEEINPLFLDDNGHGTAMAGMMCAKDNEEGITGINPNIELYSVKALDNENKAPLSRIVEGIYWGIENKIDIINMSFGTTVDSDILHQAIRDANSAGILLIASAGNTKHHDVRYPAAYPEVIAVGSTAPDGTISDNTSIGKELDILAPGEQVMTTGLLYGVCGTGGTSIAAAQVTGIASLLLSKGKKSPSFIKQILKESAKQINSASNLNAGLIDCQYAYQLYDTFKSSYENVEVQEAMPKNKNTVQDYSKDADKIVEGMWGANSHDTILKYAAKDTSLTCNDLSTIARISYKADSVYSASSNATHKTTCLHGNWNYVASLKFLWNFALTIQKKSSLSLKKQVDRAKTSSCNKISTKTFSTTELKEYNTLVNNTCYLVKTEGDASSGRHNRNLVFGFIFHLLGDIYAHTVIIPNYTIQNCGITLQNSSSLDSKDARLGSGDFQQQGWKTIKSQVGKETFAFTDLNQYAKTWTDNYGNTKRISTESNYEDNTNFCRRRYSEAKLASKYFLANYSKGFLLDTLTPRYGFKLSQYRHWAINAGYKDYYNIDAWSKITS